MADILLMSSKLYNLMDFKELVKIFNALLKKLGGLRR